MTEQKSNSWDIPVAFYFRVTFTIEGGSHQCSFMTVDGLGQTLDYKTQAQQGDNVVWLPEKVSHTDITLKRALESTPDAVDNWIKRCFKFANTGYIKPCQLTISLLNAECGEISTWKCSSVVPKSWSIDTLNAQESKAVIQTLVLKHSGIE